jgi:hypothetical protein
MSCSQQKISGARGATTSDLFKLRQRGNSEGIGQAGSSRSLKERGRVDGVVLISVFFRGVADGLCESRGVD